jgi:hypothetical protein
VAEQRLRVPGADSLIAVAAVLVTTLVPFGSTATADSAPTPTSGWTQLDRFGGNFPLDGRLTRITHRATGQPGLDLLCRFEGTVTVPARWSGTEAVLSVTVGGRTCVQALIRPAAPGAFLVDSLSLAQGHRITYGVRGKPLDLDLVNFTQLKQYGPSEPLVLALESDVQGPSVTVMERTGLWASAVSATELDLRVHAMKRWAGGSTTVPVEVRKRGTWGKASGTLRVELRMQGREQPIVQSRPMTIAQPRQTVSLRFANVDPGQFVVSASIPDAFNGPSWRGVGRVDASDPGRWMMALGLAIICMGSAVRARRVPGSGRLAWIGCAVVCAIGASLFVLDLARSSVNLSPTKRSAAGRQVTTSQAEGLPPVTTVDGAEARIAHDPILSRRIGERSFRLESSGPTSGGANWLLIPVCTADHSSCPPATTMRLRD